MDAVEPFPLRQPRRVADVGLPGAVPLFTQEAWRSRFSWLFQATTGIGSAGDPFDLSFFGNARAGEVMDRWRAIRETTGFDRVVHARQVHQATVLVHSDVAPGTTIHDDADGHVTATRGVLLAVSIADCVPVFVVDEDARAIALLHAGWRGAAAGILERGLMMLQQVTRGGLDSIHVHLGPAICGDCYEVGPEVFLALGLPRPEGNAPIDLRAALADRAVRAGVPAENVTASSHCTRCGDGFFSHRRGDRGRQMGLIGIRAA